MDVLLNHCLFIRKQCTTYRDFFVSRYHPEDPRVACFAMIFNHATVALELLHHYSQVWKQINPAGMSDEDINRSREENTQRCVHATRAFFIESISSIEFCFRLTIKNLPPDHPLKSCIQRREKLFSQFEPLYQKLDQSDKEWKSFRKQLRDVPPFDSFSRIIKKSTKQGFLNEKEAFLWNYCINLRNCAVHNNAIADKNCVFECAGQSFEMIAGQMIQGKLDCFTYLTLQLVRSLFVWFQKIDLDSEEIMIPEPIKLKELSKKKVQITPEGTKIDMEIINSVGIKNITELSSYHISNESEKITHEIQFNDGGSCKISYTQEGKLLEFSGDRLNVEISKDNKLILSRFTPSLEHKNK